MLDFLVITIVILLITQWLRMKPLFWKNAGIPYSVPLPIIGSTFSSLYRPMYEMWTDMYNKIGDSDVYGFHFFGYPALITSDPNLVKKFTVTDADSFMSHGLSFDEEYDPLAKGIFIANGEQWRVSRAKMTPYFTPARIKSMLPMIHESANNFVTYVDKEGEKGPVEFNSASIKLAVDIIVSTTFGLEPDSFKNPNSFFYGMQKELISFSLGFKMMLGILSPALLSYFKLTTFSKKTTKTLAKFVSDVINQRMKGVGNRPDFVEGMLELMKKESNETKRETERYADGTIIAKFDLFSVTGHCALMYLAGTETTGNTLSYIFYELAKNQEVQDKTRNEIVSMIKRTKGDYGLEDFHGLEYVQAVIKETLRLYPVLMVYFRHCTKPIDFKGIRLPVGTKIILCPFALHRDPRHFPEPEIFKPERFLNDSNLTPGTYIPFGMGPRTCIGMKFAETEIALAMCKILPKFKLMTSGKSEFPIKFANYPTLNPKNGIWLNVEKIY